ncbi:hypothetical protein GOV07_00745 [Candidatus Woesearchaeota archaeon]|nr:hypothetical protein [Candidatus Woesearchaeota archaeon]
MSVTTIKVRTATKQALDTLREYPGESYDRLVGKAVHIAKTAKKEPKLSQATIRQIEEARERFTRGEYYTEDQAWKILGVDDV